MTLKVEKGKEERRRIFYQPSHTTEFSSILVSHYLNPVFFSRETERAKNLLSLFVKMIGLV